MRGLFQSHTPIAVDGYEIHMGVTESESVHEALFQLTNQGAEHTSHPDGAISRDGWIAGTYLHGLFDNDMLRHTLLTNLANRRGIVLPDRLVPFTRLHAYDRLAQVVQANLDIPQIQQIIGL